MLGPQHGARLRGNQVCPSRRPADSSRALVPARGAGAPHRRNRAGLRHGHRLRANKSLGSPGSGPHKPLHQSSSPTYQRRGCGRGPIAVRSPYGRTGPARSCRPESASEQAGKAQGKLRSESLRAELPSPTRVDTLDPSPLTSVPIRNTGAQTHGSEQTRHRRGPREIRADAGAFWERAILALPRRAHG